MKKMYNFQNVKKISDAELLYSVIETDNDKTLHLNQWLKYTIDNNLSDYSKFLLNKYEIISEDTLKLVMLNKKLTIEYYNRFDKQQTNDLLLNSMKDNWIDEKYFNAYYYLVQVNYFEKGTRLQKLGNYHFYYAILNAALYMTLSYFIAINKGLIYFAFSAFFMNIFDFPKINLKFGQELILLKMMLICMANLNHDIFYILTFFTLFIKTLIGKEKTQLIITISLLLLSYVVRSHLDYHVSQVYYNIILAIYTLKSIICIISQYE